MPRRGPQLQARLYTFVSKFLIYGKIVGCRQVLAHCEVILFYRSMTEQHNHKGLSKSLFFDVKFVLPSDVIQFPPIL